MKQMGPRHDTNIAVEQPKIYVSWSPSPDTAVALGSLVLVIILNYLWQAHLGGGLIHPIIHFLVEILGICLILPLYWMLIARKRGFDSLGLDFRKPGPSLWIGLALTGLLLLLYSWLHGLNTNDIPLWIIGLGNLSSLIFFYGWLQLRFEEAFGLVPSIILAGLAVSLSNMKFGYFGDGYSDFHALFIFFIGGALVGLIFRLTKKIIILWPFLFPLIWLFMARSTNLEPNWFMAIYWAAFLLCMLLILLVFRRISRRPPRPWAKKVFIGLCVLVFLSLGYLWQKEIVLMSAQKAQYLCSGVFVSHRAPDDIESDDLALLWNYPGMIDYGDRSVTASFLGTATRRAIFRPGLGCTQVLDYTEDQIRQQTATFQPPAASEPSNLPWPAGDNVQYTSEPETVNLGRLNAAVDKAFYPPGPGRPPLTKAVVVVHGGRIVAERYAPGFTEHTPIIGHSMTKSVTGALVGILVGRGMLNLDRPALVPAWGKPNDPRRAITLGHLLHMTSGLQWNENYVYAFNDVRIMVHARGDAAAYAANKPLEAAPGEKWLYSTGTTEIISAIIRDAVGGTPADYFSFPRRVLFDRLDMPSAILEPDASGVFLGGSRMYATARDWARFGRLYLEDGLWNGERILPKGWVTYTHTPAPAAPYGIYGAHFWLNAGSLHTPSPKKQAMPLEVKFSSPYRNQQRLWPRLPSDTYTTWGYGGQFVTIIPSRDLVVVRLGHGADLLGWSLYQQESFLAEVLKTIP